MSSRGSKHVGMERSARRSFGHRFPQRKSQAAAPKLPGAVAERARSGLQHDFRQPIIPERLLEAAGVDKGAKVHGLSDDTLLRVGFISYRLPPDVLASKLLDQVL